MELYSSWQKRIPNKLPSMKNTRQSAGQKMGQKLAEQTEGDREMCVMWVLRAVLGIVFEQRAEAREGGSRSETILGRGRCH